MIYEIDCPKMIEAKTVNKQSFAIMQKWSFGIPYYNKESE